MIRRALPLMTVLMMLTMASLGAGEATAGCASVSIEILQEVTIERVAFDAKLRITNGIPDQDLQNIRVDVVVKDDAGNVKTDLFFVRPPILTDIGGALDGTGSVAAGNTGEAHWLIIPSPGAGFIEENGAIKQIAVDYLVGATLSYTVNGQQETVPINPARITVKPMPQLVFDYFMPSSVLGDNPFTPQVEPPVPYPLGVRVLNDGYGQANRLKIDSAQPKIVDNKQGLLVDFRILGASVNDGPVSPSLIVDLGDLPSKKAASASWKMISTLSGRFVDFMASFTHASELGGDLTSLIRETNAHYLTHMVKVNLPGRDGRLDFLADLTEAVGFIYESEIPNGSTRLEDARTPVAVLSPLAVPARPTSDAPSVPLVLPMGVGGWIYTKMADPSQGMLKLLEITRADGVKLDPNNIWVDQGVDKNYKKTWTLQFVDYRASTGTTGSYTLKFTTPDVDTTPPATSLIFDGPAVGLNPAYITPQTRVILTATDNEGGSGIEGMYRKVAEADADFVPALPFTLPTGSHTVSYYSADRAGNVESAKDSTVIVVGDAPVISSFAATPATFTPQAPRGIKGARNVEFAVVAASSAANLPVEVAIAAGAAFQADKVIRTLTANTAPTSTLKLSWDGRDGAGNPVPTGLYVARLKVCDGLDNPADTTAPNHTATRDVTITAAEWFAAEPLDPNPAADQMYPRASGSRVVWQDHRSGSWDIYVKNLSDSTITKIPGATADRQHPAIDGTLVVWQDRRSGGWEIYGYDLATGGEIAIATGTGDKERPVVSVPWVAWQDLRNGNSDIYAYNLDTHETVQITSHERDQLHPAITGTKVFWEDYRNGLGEIYAYDLASATETRITFDQESQTAPAGSGAALVWTDQRNGQTNIYGQSPEGGVRRITYGEGDHSQPALAGDLLVYTDFESGLEDPNLSFRLLANGLGGRLSANAARQEDPAIGANIVVWQDNRDGAYQIYGAALATEEISIEAALKPGFNLVAVGSVLASAYPSAGALMAAKGEELGIERILSLDPLHNTYKEAVAGGEDFSLVPGMGIVLYVAKGGALTLAESGEAASYTLLPGTNQIGMLSVPYGYGAHELMRSVGLAAVQSVRRFDAETGSWQSVAVRQTEAGPELVGENFIIQPGDGLMIVVKSRVDGWVP